MSVYVLPFFSSGIKTSDLESIIQLLRSSFEDWYVQTSVEVVRTRSMSLYVYTGLRRMKPCASQGCTQPRKPSSRWSQFQRFTFYTAEQRK